jgi:hypothetical protein
MTVESPAEAQADFIEVHLEAIELRCCLLQVTRYFTSIDIVYGLDLDQTSNTAYGFFFRTDIL